MKKLTYINSSGGEISFSSSAPFLLQGFTDSEGVNIYNAKSIKQDGATYLDNTLDIRDLTLEVAVIATSEAELISYKNKINRVFNPKLGEGWLVYKDDLKERKVKCILNKIPLFIDVNSSVSEGLVSLTGNNPFWLDEAITSEQITIWIGGMSFPLSLPTAFAMAGEKKINIINSGDVETPLEIIIVGPCTNPVITNQTTGEYIKLNKIILAGESLVVTTDFGNKRVELDGVNVFNTIDLGSAFFSLQVGDNVIEGTSDNINENSTVKINYQNRYLGV